MNTPIQPEMSRATRKRIEASMRLSNRTWKRKRNASDRVFALDYAKLEPDMLKELDTRRENGLALPVFIDGGTVVDGNREPVIDREYSVEQCVGDSVLSTVSLSAVLFGSVFSAMTAIACYCDPQNTADILLSMLTGYMAVLLISIPVGFMVKEPQSTIQVPRHVKAVSANAKRTAVDITAFADEIYLAELSAEISSEITYLPAWNSPALEEHRMVFSPRRESAEIASRAAEIAVMRSKLSPRRSGMHWSLGKHLSLTVGGPTETNPLTEEQHRVLDGFLDSLRERVIALWGYAERIEKLSKDIEKLNEIERAIRLTDDIDAMAVRLGEDEMSTERLRRLRSDIETVQGRIDAQLSFITGAVPALATVKQLTR